MNIPKKQIFGNTLCQPKRKSRGQQRLKLILGLYMESPFGYFDNFRRVFNKCGTKRYSYYLNSKRFIIRVESALYIEKKSH